MAAVFRSNSNITISAAFPVHSAKKCICIHIPRQARKFINSRQNNSRTLGVYFLIDKINRDWYPVVDAVVTAEPVPLAAGAAEEAGVSSLGRQADRDKTSRAERPAQTRFIIEESSFGKG